MSIGNHAFVALSSGLMTAQWLCATQTRGWMVRLMDREPIVFFSCLLGTVGCGRGARVPPVVLAAKARRGGAGARAGARAARFVEAPAAAIRVEPRPREARAPLGRVRQASPPLPPKPSRP